MNQETIAQLITALEPFERVAARFADERDHDMAQVSVGIIRPILKALAAVKSASDDAALLNQFVADNQALYNKWKTEFARKLKANALLEQGYCAWPICDCSEGAIDRCVRPIAPKGNNS